MRNLKEATSVCLNSIHPEYLLVREISLSINEGNRRRMSLVARVVCVSICNFPCHTRQIIFLG